MAQPGHVYMVHGQGTRYVKIGKSGNLFKRLMQVQSGVPFQLILLAVESVDDTSREENALHTRYRAYRIRRDWYELPEATLEDLRAQQALPGSEYSRLQAELLSALNCKPLEK